MKKIVLIVIFCLLAVSLASCREDTETLEVNGTILETTTISEISEETTETTTSAVTTTSVETTTTSKTTLVTTSAIEKPITTPAPVAPVTTVKPVVETTTVVTPTSTVTTKSVVTTVSEVTTLPTVLPTSTVTNASSTPPLELNDKEVALPKSIKDLAEKQKFESEIAVYNFKTKEFYYYNADKMIYSASIQKLPYSYFCYDKIEDGVAKLSDTKVFLEKFRRGGTGILKTKKSGTTWTLEQLLYYTIQCSDNTGYMMLQDKFGYQDYNNMIKSWGYTPTLSSTIKYGRVSAKLIERSLKEVFAKREADDNWKKLYASMKETSYSPFRTALGENYSVADKIGWAEDAYHDGAIIETEDICIAAVVLTRSAGSNSGQSYVQNAVKEIVRLEEEKVKKP